MAVQIPPDKIQSSARISWVDVAKSLAIYAIVLGHTLRGGDLQVYLYSFHVPLFFLISGFCFSTRNEESFHAFVNRKSFAFLIPYFIFGILSIGLFLVFGSSAANDLNVPLVGNGFIDYFLGLLYGNAATGMMKFNQPLWFLPCLYIVELFSYWIVLLIKRFTLIRGRIGILITFVAIFSFLGLLTSAPDFPALPFGINTAISTMVFFLTGIGLRLLYNHIKGWHAFRYPRSMRCGFGLFGVILIISGAYLALMNGPVDYVHNTYGNYVLFLTSAFCGCFGWIEVSLCIRSNSVLNFIGKNTLIILCLHKFPVLLFQTKIGFTASKLASFDIGTGIVVALISLLICLPIGSLFERYVPFILGKKPKCK